VIAFGFAALLLTLPGDQNDLDDLNLPNGVVGPIRNDKRRSNPDLVFSTYGRRFDVFSLLIRVGSKRIK
jgi:hypothetical protein